MTLCVPFWPPTHAQRRAALAPASHSRGSTVVPNMLRHVQCAAFANISRDAPVNMSLLR